MGLSRGCFVHFSASSFGPVLSSQDLYLSDPEPPPAPPQMTVDSKSYQGVSPSNIVTLTEGYSGDVTCRVEGGYPAAHTTQLKCGQLVDTGAGHTAALSFQADQLTREMNGTVCTCTSQHDTGCYSKKETQLTINVLCKYISCERC